MPLTTQQRFALVVFKDNWKIPQAAAYTAAQLDEFGSWMGILRGGMDDDEYGNLLRDQISGQHGTGTGRFA